MEACTSIVPLALGMFLYHIVTQLQVDGLEMVVLSHNADLDPFIMQQHCTYCWNRSI